MKNIKNPEIDNYNVLINKRLSINTAINLVGKIIQNTIFSEKESESTMKLFSNSVKEDIIKKCYEVLKIYNIPIPEKQFELLSRNECIGTSFQGYLLLNYNQIVELFGPSNYGPSGDGKIDWEWVLKLNGEVITIYNYKTGPSYSKQNINVKPQDLKRWHIGGTSKEVLANIENYIGISGVVVEC
jgi:hypothetical protein